MTCPVDKCHSQCAEGEKLCHYHLRKQAKLKPKPIPKESKKRAKENREYSVKAKAFKDGKECALKLKGCTGKATEVHHQKSGYKRAESLLDESTWTALCHNCHVLTHSIFSAEELRKMGLKK